MNGLFQSGRVVLWIIAFMGLELTVLIIVRMKTLRGLPPGELLISMSAGAALLMALRGSLTGAAWRTLSLWLGAALVFHLWDLQRRWTARRTS